MGNHNGILSKVLEALVEEWGYERVALELSHAGEWSRDKTERSGVPANAHQSKPKARLRPTEQVERVPLDPARKEAVLRLAERYERRQFLPSVGAVREFLTMMGHTPKPMKDRDQAFRILLRSLLQLPTDRLNQFLSSSLHSGPSQLGPISEAIAAAGEHLPRGPLQAHSETSGHSEEERTYPPLSSRVR